MQEPTILMCLRMKGFQSVHHTKFFTFFLELTTFWTPLVSEIWTQTAETFFKMSCVLQKKESHKSLERHEGKSLKSVEPSVIRNS